MEELLLNPEGYPDFDYAPNLGREDAAEAMSIAHELLDTGEAVDMSDALSTAWSIVKGEEKPSGLTQLELSPLSWLLIGAGAFTAIWKWTKGAWWWESIAAKRTAANASRFLSQRTVSRPTVSNPQSMTEVLARSPATVKPRLQKHTTAEPSFEGHGRRDHQRY